MIHKLLATAVVLLTFDLVFVVLNLSRCFIFKLVNAIGTHIVISYNVLVYFIHLASESSFYLLLIVAHLKKLFSFRYKQGFTS